MRSIGALLPRDPVKKKGRFQIRVMELMEGRRKKKEKDTAADTFLS